MRLVEPARRRLRRARRPAAGVLHLAAGAVRAARRLAPTRCSPRSPPRASRSSPTTATTPRSGWCGSATAPRCRTRGCRPGSAASGRSSTSCSWPTRSTAALPGVAVDPAAARAEFDAVLDAVLADRDADRPGRRAAGRGRGPHRPRRRAHRGARATCWPSCRAWPAPTRTRHGDPAGTRLAAARRIAAGCPTPSCRCSPGRPRHPARRQEDDGTLVVTITPTYSGCPALARCATTCTRAAARPASPTSRCAPCWRPPGPATGSPTRAAASSPSRRHRAARTGVRAGRPGAAHRSPWPAPATACAARAAGPPTPR